MMSLGKFEVNTIVPPLTHPYIATYHLRTRRARCPWGGNQCSRGRNRDLVRPIFGRKVKCDDQGNRAMVSKCMVAHDTF